LAISDFTIIRRSMTARLFSTVTTSLTVCVAVALMLVLLSMRDSGREAFKRGSGNMQLLISRDASPLVAVLNGVFYANAPRAYIEWGKFEQIRDGFPWEFAIPTQLGDSYRGMPVLATTEEFFTLFWPTVQAPWRLAQGRFFEKSFEVVVGAQAARLSGLRVGDEIFLTHGLLGGTSGGGGGAGTESAAPHVHKEFAYRVVGILEPTGSPHDRALFTDLISSWILHAHDRRLAESGGSVSMTTEADLLEEDRKITGIYAAVMGRGGGDLSAMLPVVFDQLRRDTSLTVANPADQIDKLFRIVANIDDILLAMAAVVMVSSGISIMIALYNSMEQRRRQIAILRVLGCSRGRIFGLVLTESVMLGLIGAAAGLVVSAVGVQIVAAVMKARLGLLIEPWVGLEWAVVVAAGTVVLAGMAGIVPAVMAYRTSVARSLRPLG